MKYLFRAFLLISVTCALRVEAQDEAVPFSFELLQQRVKELASKPYVPPVSRVPTALTRPQLDYDQYRDIRFNPGQAWWRKEQLPFQLQFFHPGFVYTQTVQINEIVGGKARMIPFTTKLFNYGKNAKLDGNIPEDMGFSGLRVHYPLNRPAYFDELLVFQGASYFRALSQGARYGLSARGLALNTAEPGGEEFPAFQEFWVERPAVRADSLKIYALLDSPSVAGAYEFITVPGMWTVMQVRAVLYRREGTDEQVRVLGIAPLTSMFWFGKNSENHYGDLRPEVHDSDGLSLHTGKGEWLWRPLTNPSSVQVASFIDENPRGFGLLQRDRHFASYEDIEAAYHLRPSAWVEPVGNWGRGAVRLVEIPTPDETNDNVVVFWTPEKLPPVGEPLEIAYRLYWYTREVTTGNGGTPPNAIVVASRQGYSKTHEPELRRFWVDFTGEALTKREAGAKIEAAVTVGAGAKLVHAGAEKNPFNNTWRAAFAIKPDGSGRPVELRCFLKDGQNALTETWSYLWNP